MEFPTYGLNEYANGELRRAFLGLTLLTDDARDYRAMLAREVARRKFSALQTPASFVAFETANGCTIREDYEHLIGREVS
jgi:hypothetical protein